MDRFSDQTTKNLRALATRVPGRLPPPAGSVEECRQALIEEAYEVVADTYPPEYALDYWQSLQLRFNEYVAALIYVGGIEREEAIRQSVALVEEIAS